MNIRKLIAFACAPVLVISFVGSIAFRMMIAIARIEGLQPIEDFYLWLGVVCGILTFLLLIAECYKEWCLRSGRASRLTDEGLSIAYLYATVFVPGILIAFSAVLAGTVLLYVWSGQDVLLNVASKHKSEISRLRESLENRKSPPVPSKPRAAH